jgi:hypothetical protein
MTTVVQHGVRRTAAGRGIESEGAGGGGRGRCVRPPPPSLVLSPSPKSKTGAAPPHLRNTHLETAVGLARRAEGPCGGPKMSRHWRDGGKGMWWGLRWSMAQCGRERGYPVPNTLGTMTRRVRVCARGGAARIWGRVWWRVRPPHTERCAAASDPFTFVCDWTQTRGPRVDACPFPGLPRRRRGRRWSSRPRASMENTDKRRQGQSSSGPIVAPVLHQRRLYDPSSQQSDDVGASGAGRLCWLSFWGATRGPHLFQHPRVRAHMAVDRDPSSLPFHRDHGHGSLAAVRSRRAAFRACWGARTEANMMVGRACAHRARESGAGGAARAAGKERRGARGHAWLRRRRRRRRL